MNRILNIFIMVILIQLTACFPATRTMNSLGESIVLSDHEPCATADCLPDDLAPLIDFTDNIPEPESQPAEDLITPPSDELVTDEEELCDDTIDEDGDGLFCNCDANDKSARNSHVIKACDQDGDLIPDMYDLCPEHHDTDNVVIVHLCDDHFETDGIVSDVDYDSERWTGENCRLLKSTAQIKEKFQFIKKSANFPILYIYKDNNNNGRPDGCRKLH